MMQESVLLVGSTEKGRTLMQTLVPQTVCTQCRVCSSGGEARRLMPDGDWGLIVINTPLSDESGLELASEMAHQTLAGVLLLVKSELADTVMERVEAEGVMVVGKPVAKPLFEQAERFALAARHRLATLRAENDRLEKKLIEEKNISRAKCTLMEYLGMTEEQAHRQIEKQAMDSRQTRAAVARIILANYEL